MESGHKEDQASTDEESTSPHQVLISNIIQKIESLPGIVNVCYMDYQGADQNDIQAWERKYNCNMPEDLRSFYATSNGFSLTWSILFDGQKQSLGRMEINSLNNLKRINNTRNVNGSIALDDLTCSDDESQYSASLPQFDPSQSWIFELDNCNGYGKVCLVYRMETESKNQISKEIWFLDRSLGWHHLTDSFTKYFRLMIMHLGLPQWQYALTSIGLSPTAKQWFHMYAPIRLAVDTGNVDVNKVMMQNDESIHNKLDVKRLFSTKSEKPDKNIVGDRRKPSSAKRSNSNLNRSTQSKAK